MSELTIRNMEALANDENTDYTCWGIGDIDCYGVKVKLKIDDWSLGF